MLKTLLLFCLAVMLSVSAGWAAAVEVNTADQAALESVKGIGPVHAKAIVDERTKNGPFKNADDLAARVKGLGTRSVTNLEAAGLTVNGSSAPPTGTKGSSMKPGTKAVPKTMASEANTAAASAPGDASAAKHTKSKKSKSKGASVPAASGS